MQPDERDQIYLLAYRDGWQDAQEASRDGAAVLRARKEAKRLAEFQQTRQHLGVGAHATAEEAVHRWSFPTETYVKGA